MNVQSPPAHTEAGHFKDSILDSLAQHSNVAQFVSFSPDREQRHAWIHGYEPNHAFESAEHAVQALFESSPEASVNIRSFEPHHPKSREFHYGQRSVDQVMGHLHRLSDQGLHTIVNETIDVDDGGVSGVAFGEAVEFAPGDTPRCVEKPGTASLPRQEANRLFEVVYGFLPTFPQNHDLRVEFSLHPLRRGYRHDHTVTWEIEDVGHPPRQAYVNWPNLFSRFIGDKAYGLLVADLSGLPVPRTQVLPRGLAPFRFGRDTGVAEVWIRTCPKVQVPGLFTTQRGWRDPYRLMQEEDPEGDLIASLLSQQSVEPVYSGAVLPQTDGGVLIEGVSGRGDDFMQGERAPESLPADVEASVRQLHATAGEHLAGVRFEWVHDGEQPWVVQLHVRAEAAAGRVIFPGEPARWHSLDVSEGIDGLRALIDEVGAIGDGIVLSGRVGLTSHWGDLLRRAEIPSRIEVPVEAEE